MQLFLIGGPTASGKTALALRLAREIDGEIVGADALQLYRDLRILSARPSPEEEASAPHHLIGVADAAEAWSVGRWLAAAGPVFEAIAARGRAAIVVGGTGLYFRALTEGLVQLPAVPPEIRQVVQARFDQLGETHFRAALATVDPVAEARISPGDRQRLARALEVHAATGRALSDWQSEASPPLAAAGALEEVRGLLARGLDPELPAMKAVGVRELGAHLSGDISLEAAIALGQQQTRRYAKRQTTWFRNQTPDWPRIAEADPEAQAVALARLWAPA